MPIADALPNNANLRQLSAIRAVVLGGQLLARYLAETKLGWMMPYVTLDLLLSVLAGFALLSWWRSYRPWPVTDPELFVHFAVDVVGFSAVLYFSGGASNPFISYLLVPLCLSAATLPWLYTWLLGGLSLAFYSALLFYNVPLAAIAPAQHGHENTSFHTIGMWLNFVVSAALISYFVFKMASQLRRREQELAQIRERQLQNDQLLAVAALAAGTAHELGTPLSTIKLIGEDLQDELQDSPMSEDIDALNGQVQQCQQILEKLVNTARELSNGDRQHWCGDQFFDQLRERWQILHPDCAAKFSVSEHAAALALKLDGTVSQSILNLLNNAADVSPDDVCLAATVENDSLIIAISDRGPGLAAGSSDHLRKAFVSSKGNGMGLGLFLSHASAERYRGSLRWLARAGGGSRLELRLPLKAICEVEERG